MDGSPIGQWEGFLEYILYISVLSYWPAGRVFIVHSVHNFCSPIGRASYWQVERVARIHSVHNFALLLAGSPIGQQEGCFEYIMFISWLSNWLRRNAVQKICSNFPETVFTNFIILVNPLACDIYKLVSKQLGANSPSGSYKRNS